MPPCVKSPYRLIFLAKVIQAKVIQAKVIQAKVIREEWAIFYPSFRARRGVALACESHDHCVQAGVGATVSTAIVIVATLLVSLQAISGE
jgi:hypothetical protein